jgi:hypothetical protein
MYVHVLHVFAYKGELRPRTPKFRNSRKKRVLERWPRSCWNTKLTFVNRRKQQHSGVVCIDYSCLVVDMALLIPLALVRLCRSSITA